MDFLLRLRILRYRQTPMLLKRVKAHAIGVSILAFTPAAFLNLANFRIQDSNGRFLSVVFIVLCYVTIRNLFEGFTYCIVINYYSVAKIEKKYIDSK